ncbi:MAG: hypothetical protein LBI33_12575 [Propionibacteriaceae bacterium]|jgi:hypothetical protein|nr:hypothetical protein [Propionibacteriaceae bacterium]
MTKLSRLAVVVAVACLAGCSGDSSDNVTVADQWREQIDTIFANAQNLSDFQRSVLEDYQITDAEYKEGETRFSSCMADLGYAVTFDSRGGYTESAVNGVGSGDMSKADSQCQDESLLWIQGLYFAMRENPDGLPFAQLVRTCFEREGVQEGKDLSSDEFDKMINEPDYVPSDVAASLCVLDPTATRGVSREEAEQYLHRQGHGR